LKDYYHENSEVVYSSKAFTLKETSKPTQGTHFYIVNQSIYDKIIDFLENFLDKRLNDKDFTEDDRELGKLDGAYLDTAYFLFRKHCPEVKSLIACPSLGWQRSSYSNITTSAIDLKISNKQVLHIYRSVKSSLKKNLESVNPYWQ
jgi:glycosyl transferase, family 25